MKQRYDHNGVRNVSAAINKVDFVRIKVGFGGNSLIYAEVSKDEARRIVSKVESPLYGTNQEVYADTVPIGEKDRMTTTLFIEIGPDPLAPNWEDPITFMGNQFQRILDASENGVEESTFCRITHAIALRGKEAAENANER